MNEEKPKSIWKKSLKGPRDLLLWLIPFTLVFAVIYANNGVPDSLKNYLGLPIYALFFSLFVMLMLLLVIRFVHWLFCWRNFRRFLFGLACFATLIALFYAEEDWRGKHDWEKYKHEWEAKGERFDFASVIPPPVPDNQNFAMSPVMVESMKAVLGPKNSSKWFGEHYAENGRTNFTDRLQMSISHDEDFPSGTRVNWATAKTSDLKVWQNYYRTLAATTNEFPTAPQPQSPAADVLLALSNYDSAIEELRQASQLPYSRFPLNYDTQPPAAILLPHLVVLKRCSQVLQLRAIAELQNNESQKALDDVKLSLRLIDSIHTEPFLISHLVRIAIFQIALQPIYESLAEHKWSDEQLVALDSELAKLDFLADYEFSTRGERALQIANIEFLRHPSNVNIEFRRPHLYFIAPFFSLVQMLSNMSGSGEDSQMGFSMLPLSLGPSGWLNQNELRIAQFDTKWNLPIVDEDTKTISPAKARAVDSAFGQEIQHRTPENLLQVWLMPDLGIGVKKFAYAQTSMDLARVAIALERYRLAYGEFPESLDALASQFIAQIPHDIINGQPLHYRRTSDGRFVLYSVGWNETDDGGVVGMTDGKAPVVDINKGDWVWRYPSK